MRRDASHRLRLRWLGRRGVARPLPWIGAIAFGCVATTALGVSTATAASLSATSASGLHVTVVVNGQPALTSSDARPAQLYPTRPAEIRVAVANDGTTTVHVSTVRFQGQVMDLPLFSYDSAVNLSVPPGTTRSITFPVSMTGVGSQATGLVVASVTLLSPGGAAVASQTLVTKVHGSLKSIYGLFGLAVLILTASSLLFALLAMARHRLPQNRWLRAVRFLVPGFGIGLVLTFTLAAFGIFAPGPGHWLAVLIVTSAGSLALGYLTPAPNEEEFDDYDESVLLAQILVVDDDPLEENGTRDSMEGERTPVTVSAAAPGSVARPTTAPDTRATTAPDSFATTEPDSRATVAPEMRPESAPDSRPTADPVTEPSP